MLTCRKKSSPQLFLSEIPIKQETPGSIYLEKSVEVSGLACRCLSAELQFLEKISEDLVYISTWEGIKQWLSHERSKKRVWNTCSGCPCTNFTSIFCVRKPGRTNALGSHSEQTRDSINSLWGFLWYYFLFRLVVQVQGF